MKKTFIPFVVFLFLHTPYTQPNFSEGFVIGGLAGLTTGLITSAATVPCSCPEIVFFERYPFKGCSAGVSRTPSCAHRPGAGAKCKRYHTKVKGLPRSRKGRRPQAPLLKRQRANLVGSIRELEVLKESLCQESKRVDLMIKKMELKLKETQLRLQC